MVDTVNPLAAASPPEAPVTVAPSTSNWNPPISASLLYNTSMVPLPTSMDKVFWAIPNAVKINIVMMQKIY